MRCFYRKCLAWRIPRSPPDLPFAAPRCGTWRVVGESVFCVRTSAPCATSVSAACRFVAGSYQRLDRAGHGGVCELEATRPAGRRLPVTVLQFYGQGTGLAVPAEVLRCCRCLATIVILVASCRNPQAIVLNKPITPGHDLKAHQVSNATGRGAWLAWLAWATSLNTPTTSASASA
jgi:hypothetical protein